MIAASIPPCIRSVQNAECVAGSFQCPVFGNQKSSTSDGE